MCNDIGGDFGIQKAIKHIHDALGGYFGGFIHHLQRFLYTTLHFTVLKQ